LTTLSEADLAEAAEVVAQAAEGRAALNRRDALIRKWRAGGVTSRDVEEAFGLSRSSVAKIVAART